MPKPIDQNINNKIDEKKTHKNASTRHIIETAQNQKTSIFTKDLSFKKARIVNKFKSRAADIVNLDITQYTKHLKSLAEGNRFGSLIMKVSSNKWGRTGLMAAGISIGVSMLTRVLNKNPQDSALPTKYKRGYDVMEENLTDYGSPAHLLKTASKVIVPYYSSIRKGITTNIRQITNSNIALKSSKNAIKHTRY